MISREGICVHVHLYNGPALMAPACNQATCQLHMEAYSKRAGKGVDTIVGETVERTLRMLFLHQRLIVWTAGCLVVDRRSSRLWWFCVQ